MQTQVFNLVKMTAKKSLNKTLYYGWRGKRVDQ